MITRFIQFAGDESGVTGIEYGLIAALVVLGIISVVTSIGTTLAANFYGPIASGFN
ncbi:MAG: Flp family type IVb pilin [Methylocella sp.]